VATQGLQEVGGCYTLSSDSMKKARVLKLLKAAAVAVFLGLMGGLGKGFGLFLIAHLLR
jgi:hypothetical protein